MNSDASEPQTDTKDEAAKAANRPRTSRGRIWLFRLISLIVIPTMFFGLLELGLRVFGYGYDTRYFVPAPEVRGGADGDLETNPRFAWRFYPATGAKPPLPIRINPSKPAKTVRIFIFGGSAAMGSPDAAYSFGRILDVMLTERYPQRQFEVVVTAMEGMNSHVSRVIAEEAASLEPDLFVVYLGNNEVVGPHGVSDVFGGYASSLGAVRASLWIKSTRTGQLVGDVIDAATGRGNQVWKGMASFAGAGVAADDDRLTATYENFAGNLEAIRELAAGAGAKSIVCTVATNLRDCPPFISPKKPGLSDADVKRFDERCAAGRKLAADGDHDGAMAAFGQARAIDPGSANLEYWMGRCRLAQSRTDEAVAHLTRARDLDMLRVRADTKINEILREAGRNYDGFVDFQRALAGDPQPGRTLPGRAMFLDHCHLNFRGNCRLAAGVLDQVAGVLQGKLGKSAPSATAPAPDEHLARALAMTGWDRFCIARIVAAQMAQPPFTNQADAHQRLAEQQAHVESLRLFTQPKVRQAIFAQYLRALNARPDDVMLRANYGRCLLGLGNPAAAGTEYEELVRKFPNSTDFRKELGVVLMRQGRLSEAGEQFRAALEVLPRDLDAMSNLGTSLLWQGRLDDAAELFDEVLAARPDHADARVNLGIVLAKKSDPAGAAEQFQHVLAADPGHVGALNNYATLLTNQNRTEEAIACYRKALASHEDSSLHLALAGLLEGRGDPNEAMGHLERAAELAPFTAEPHLALGQALLRARKYAPAARSLERALAIDDHLADAHRDLGLVLEQLRQGGRAIVELGRAVALNPNDLVARERLAFLLMSARRLDEAIRQYRAFLRARPGSAEAHNNLAVALAKTNRLDEAIVHFTNAVQLEPTGLRHYNLATQLVKRGADAEAIGHFRSAIRLRPNWPAAMGELAFVLATADEDNLRNGAEAVRLARAACELTGWREADALDALAAALAETGQFEQAAAHAAKAREIAIQRKRTSQAQRIAKRIALYESGKPCRRGAREVKQ